MAFSRRWLASASPLASSAVSAPASLKLLASPVPAWLAALIPLAASVATAPLVATAALALLR